MGEFEAIGDIAAGAAVSRAVEPNAGELSHGHTQERNCLNCGCALAGEFCHCCGQHAHVHRTLGAFFHDLAHGVLHFEGKTWRTLPKLAWKPGELTRRYIEGQRARFVSPMALFLFSVFLMFAVVSATGNLNPNINSGIKEVAEADRDARAELARLTKKRAETVQAGKPVDKIDKDIAEARDDIEVIEDLRKRGVTEAGFSRSKATVNSKLPWVKDAYHKAKRNPDLLIYKIKSNSYKWSWAIIPLSMPFLWLMFPFSRRFRIYDHVVFVTYSLSFMTLLVSAGTLIAAVGISQIAPVMLFIPPIHMFRQLKGAYSLGWFGALWRTFGLMFAAILVLTTFIVLMAGLGVMD
ncbi:MAG: DUF3667 domain-containing protein [Sphingomicrobium sp.]